MTLEYRCSNCGTLLQTTNADPLDAEIERLRAALERYGQHEDGCEVEPWHGKGPFRCSCGLYGNHEQ